MNASTEAPPTFAALGLQQALADAVAALGYEEPTPVQRETIPLLLAGPRSARPGGDRHGQDRGVRAADAAADQPAARRPAARQTGGLVLVPTRELAMQVAEAMHKYAKGVGLTVAAALRRRADASADPRARARRPHRRRHARAARSITCGAARSSSTRCAVLVLDEADEMLDMGFADDLDAILKATPETRQTALFSATMPARILSIAERHLKNPARVTIAREKTAAGKLPRVRQVAYIVNRAHKPAALERRARHGGSGRDAGVLPHPARSRVAGRDASTRTATGPRRCTAA